MPLTGAVDETGSMPFYAEECASMLAVTFSGGDKMMRSIVSTPLSTCPPLCPAGHRAGGGLQLCPFPLPWSSLPVLGASPGGRLEPDSLPLCGGDRGQDGCGSALGGLQHTLPPLPPALPLCSEGMWQCRWAQGAGSSMGLFKPLGTGSCSTLAGLPLPDEFSRVFLSAFSLSLPKNDFLSPECPFCPSQAASVAQPHS